MNWTEGKINQAINDIKKKALKDEAFRKLCLENPNEAIHQVTQMDVPKGVKINIIENGPDVDHTIILPPEAKALGPEDLDRVIGGRRCTKERYSCTQKNTCDSRMGS